MDPPVNVVGMSAGRVKGVGFWVSECDVICFILVNGSTRCSVVPTNANISIGTSRGQEGLPSTAGDARPAKWLGKDSVPEHEALDRGGAAVSLEPVAVGCACGEAPDDGQ